MPVQFGPYTFKGPFTNTRELRNRPGVFIIWHKSTGVVKMVEQCLQLKNKVEEVLVEHSLDLEGEDVYELFVYHTFCLQLSEREVMVQDLKETLCVSQQV